MKEYKMICSKHIHEINERATNLLKEGWEPYGSPMTPSCNDANGALIFVYAQTFIKEIKEDGKY